MTATGIEYTAAAAGRLADYLGQVRLALAGSPGVSADEVEADIRDHVAAAVKPAGTAVTLAELDAVLAALGPPAGWRPAGPAAGFSPVAWLKSAWATVYKGPEDWRLAYVCLLLTTLAPVTLGVSLVPAYFLGRAAVELARQRGEALGARRWLVYPAILAVSLPLFGATAFGPPAVAAVVAAHATADAQLYRNAVAAVDADGVVTFRPGFDPDRGYRLNGTGVVGSAPDKKGVRVWRIPDADRQTHDRVLAAMAQLGGPPGFQPLALTAFLAAGALAGWWVVLGCLMWAVPGWLPTAFYPLLTGYDWLHGVRLAAVCGLLLAGWAGYATRL